MAGSPENVARPERRRYTLTSRALRARRENLEKARAAPRELRYPPSERRRAASLANLAKAQAARRSPESSARIRYNALRHGLYARDALASALRLAESAGEYAEHLRQTDQFFAPQDDLERRLVRRLADALWRRLRLFHAQASWEADRLRGLFRKAPRRERLLPEESTFRAWALVSALSDWEKFWSEANKLESEIENLLRRLLQLRTGEKAKFQALVPRRERFLTEQEELSAAEIAQIWQYLTPERQDQIRRMVQDALALTRR